MVLALLKPRGMGDMKLSLLMFVVVLALLAPLFAKVLGALAQALP
jgi:hypothetical protein